MITARLPDAYVRELGANPGFGAAANEVLRLVEGDNGFFCICHDDVALEPDTIRTLVEELYRSNAGLVGPKLVSWDDPGLLQHVGLGLDRFGEVDPIIEPGEYDQEQHDAVGDVFVLPSACMLTRADLFRALGGFDPAISFHGDDVDLCWRAHLSGARVVVAPQARVRHREELDGPPAGAAPRRAARPPPHAQRRHADERRPPAAALARARRCSPSPSSFVGLFTARLGEAWASLRALVGLIPRTPALLARRRADRQAAPGRRRRGPRAAEPRQRPPHALPPRPRHRDVHRRRRRRAALAGEPAQHDDRLGARRRVRHRRQPHDDRLEGPVASASSCRCRPAPATGGRTSRRRGAPAGSGRRRPTPRAGACCRSPACCGWAGWGSG